MKFALAYLAVCLGILLPVSFLRSLRSLANFENPSTIAATYLFVALLAAIVALVAYFAVAAVRRLVAALVAKSFAVTEPDLIHNTACLLLLAAGIAGPLQYWIDSIAPIPILASEWFASICVAATVLALLTARIRLGATGAQQLVTRAAARIIEPATWVGGIVLVLATCLVVFGSPRISSTNRVARPETSTAVHPNIILITLDAFSAQHSKLYGASLATTPNLNRFASGSAVFDRFYAACNFTTCSLASLHTGLPPLSHRVYSGGSFLSAQDSAQTMAARLQSAGYETAAFVSNWWASPAHLMMDGYFDVRDEFVPPGDAQGRVCALAACDLDRLRGIFPMPIVARIMLLYSRFNSERATSYPYPPNVTYSRAQNFLQRRDPSRPLFLWVHTMAPHSPLLVDPPFRGTFLPGDLYSTITEQATAFAEDGVLDAAAAAKLSLRYDELLFYADYHFGRFVDFLRTSGLIDNSLVIVTSDHGESFERGYMGHAGPRVYDNVAHIPLVVRTPGPDNPRRISVLANHLDILPTILDYAGVANPPKRSLRAALEHDSISEQPAFVLNAERNSSFSALTQGTVAVVDGNLKLIRYFNQPGFEHDELFDLASDPQESQSLIASRPDDAKRLESLIAERLRATDHASP